MSSTPDNDHRQELEGAIREVSRTFAALTKARARFNRCTREDSREAARVEMVAAEREYRQSADARDVLAELDRARRTQNGDPLGAAWSNQRNPGGPVVALVDYTKHVARTEPSATHSDACTCPYVLQPTGDLSEHGEDCPDHENPQLRYHPAHPKHPRNQPASRWSELAAMREHIPPERRAGSGVRRAMAQDVLPVLAHVTDALTHLRNMSRERTHAEFRYDTGQLEGSRTRARLKREHIEADRKFQSAAIAYVAALTRASIRPSATAEIVDTLSPVQDIAP